MQKYFINCKDGGVFCAAAACEGDAIAALAEKRGITIMQAAVCVKDMYTLSSGQASPVRLSKPKQEKEDNNTNGSKAGEDKANSSKAGSVNG